MPRLTERDALHIGDILRLPENYDLGPGSGPVDLMVYDPNRDDDGLGLIVASGYKAGFIYAILPAASGPRGAISVGWLRENWDNWFCYPYEGAMRVIPMDPALALGWSEREIREIA